MLRKSVGSFSDMQREVKEFLKAMRGVQVGFSPLRYLANSKASSLIRVSMVCLSMLTRENHHILGMIDGDVFSCYHQPFFRHIELYD
jgi:hypothetical protein